jgi:hypothetical protein
VAIAHGDHGSPYAVRPPPPPSPAPTRTPRWLLVVAAVAVLALVAVVVADPLGRRTRSDTAAAPTSPKKKSKIVAEEFPSTPPKRPSPPQPVPIDPPTRPPSVDRVEIVDMTVGTGDLAGPGTKVTVDYTGTLLDGTKFDETHGRGPFVVELGLGHLIKGFEQGVDGMRVGGKRRVTIPPELGYGDRAMAKIPAHSTLVFEIELRKVEWPAKK